MEGAVLQTRAFLPSSATTCRSSQLDKNVALSSSFSGQRLQRPSSAAPPLLVHREWFKSLQVRAVDSTRKMVPFANYAVPIDNSANSSFITRPLAEILRDLNKRVPDKVIKMKEEKGVSLKYIPWYHANRMLSFYAPGWCGEVRNITSSAHGRTVTVVYRVTLRGSDGETFREATGTASVDGQESGDPVQKAEGMAFRRACARFGLGLYLYHEDEAPSNSGD